MSSNTFNPMGPTFARTVTAASTALSPTLTNPPAAVAPLAVVLDYRFTNIGTLPVWVAYGTTAPTAAIPADGTTASGFFVEPNQTRTFEFGYGILLACIASGAGSSIYVTIGSGNNG